MQKKASKKKKKVIDTQLGWERLFVLLYDWL